MLASLETTRPQAAPRRLHRCLPSPNSTFILAFSYPLLLCAESAEPPGSLGNPFVHSLSVTLGNHTIPPFQPYNCPVRLAISKTGVWPPDVPRETLPRTVISF